MLETLNKMPILSKLFKNKKRVAVLISLVLIEKKACKRERDYDVKCCQLTVSYGQNGLRSVPTAS